LGGAKILPFTASICPSSPRPNAFANASSLKPIQK